MYFTTYNRLKRYAFLTFLFIFTASCGEKKVSIFETNQVKRNASVIKQNEARIKGNQDQIYTNKTAIEAADSSN